MTDLVRQEIAATADLLVVKIGTRPLTDASGLLDERRVAALAEEIHAILTAGRRVVLVSSGRGGGWHGTIGAWAAGRSILAQLQAVAANRAKATWWQAYERCLAQTWPPRRRRPCWTADDSGCMIAIRYLESCAIH